MVGFTQLCAGPGVRLSDPRESLPTWNNLNSMNFAGCREIPCGGGKLSPGNVLQPFASSLGCLKVRAEQNFRNKSNKPGLAAPISVFSAT